MEMLTFTLRTPRESPHENGTRAARPRVEIDCERRAAVSNFRRRHYRSDEQRLSVAFFFLFFLDNLESKDQPSSSFVVIGVDEFPARVRPDRFVSVCRWTRMSGMIELHREGLHIILLVLLSLDIDGSQCHGLMLG